MPRSLKEIEEISLPHGGTDLAASFQRHRPRARRLDDHPEGGRLPDRPPGGELAAAAGRRRRAEAGPGQARGATSRARSSSTWASRAARTARSPTCGSTMPIVTVGIRRSSAAVIHNYGPNRVDGAPRPADRRRPARPRVQPGDLPRRRGPAGRLHADVHRPRRPRGRGPDRRRPAQARQPPVAGRAGPRVPERPPGRRPLQARAVPGRDRLPGPGAVSPSEDSPGRPIAIRTEVVSESQLSRRELAPYDAVVALQHRPVHRGRGHARSTTT